MRSADKFDIQEEQYEFPYHYVPHFDELGYAKKYRHWRRGIEYLCYVKHLVERVHGLSPTSVLEVGCGDGRVIGSLSSTIRRVGVDLSERAIQFAKCFHEDIEFYAVGASEIREAFDVVLAVEVLEHIPEEKTKGFFRSLEARTRPGGHVIMSVPTVVKPLIDKHYRHYDRDLFEEQLVASGAALRLEEIEYIYNDNKIMKLYRRLTDNRLFYLELHALRRLAWKMAWGPLRFGTASNGTHLVATLVRSD